MDQICNINFEESTNFKLYWFEYKESWREYNSQER